MFPSHTPRTPQTHQRLCTFQRGSFRKSRRWVRCSHYCRGRRSSCRCRGRKRRMMDRLYIRHRALRLQWWNTCRRCSLCRPGVPHPPCTCQRHTTSNLVTCPCTQQRIRRQGHLVEGHRCLRDRTGIGPGQWVHTTAERFQPDTAYTLHPRSTPAQVGKVGCNFAR